MSGKKINYPAKRKSSQGYDLATRDELLARLAECGSLRAVCKADDMPSASVVHEWLQEDAEFAGAYARARQIGVMLFADETLEIGDAKMSPQEVAQAKLRCENRRWLAERMLPRVYGPTSAVKVEASVAVRAVSDVERRARIASILAMADARSKQSDIA